MDTETFEAFAKEVMQGSGAKRRELFHLNAGQEALYEQVCEGSIRLEQEMVAIDWVTEKLKGLMGSFGAS
jgi:hypothetical protein